MPNNRMERFTARARRVLSLAQETAEDYKHNYIGTEHLLIGLLREEGGIAGRVLRDLGLEQRRVEGLVEELTQAALQSRPTIAELSPGVKRVLELAVDEARRMGHHYIGTEHLLLGLVRQSEGVAIDVLKRLGISPEEVRRQTRRGLQESPVLRSDSPPRPPPLPPSQRANVPDSEAYLLAQTMITKLVDMVGEKKLSIEQAAELFSVIFPEINLTSTEKARLVGQFFHPEQLNHHQVRIVVSDQQEKNVLAQWTSDLVKVLRGIDRFLGVTLLTRESTEVTYNEGAIRLSLYLERDNEAGNEDAT